LIFAGLAFVLMTTVVQSKRVRANDDPDRALLAARSAAKAKDWDTLRTWLQDDFASTWGGNYQPLADILEEAPVEGSTVPWTTRAVDEVSLKFAHPTDIPELVGSRTLRLRHQPEQHRWTLVAADRQESASTEAIATVIKSLRQAADKQDWQAFSNGMLGRGMCGGRACTGLESAVRLAGEHAVLDAVRFSGATTSSVAVEAASATQHTVTFDRPPRTAGEASKVQLAFEKIDSGWRLRGTTPAPKEPGRLNLQNEIRNAIWAFAWAPELDLAIVVDTTGSMRDNLATLMRDASEYQALTAFQHPNLRVGVVVFADKAPGCRYTSEVAVPFTSDTAYIYQRMGSLPVGCGGDVPEHRYAGIHTAATRLSWRSSATKVALVLTDAPPHDDHSDVTKSAAMRAASNQGIELRVASSVE
jgi:Mg-chelatase subunit ChlD